MASFLKIFIPNLAVLDSTDLFSEAIRIHNWGRWISSEIVRYQRCV